MFICRAEKQETEVIEMGEIKMYTVEEVAILFKISKDNVIAWIKIGILEAICLPLLGDHFRVTEQCLDDFVKIGKEHCELIVKGTIGEMNIENSYGF